MFVFCKGSNSFELSLWNAGLDLFHVCPFLSCHTSLCPQSGTCCCESRNADSASRLFQHTLSYKWRARFWEHHKHLNFHWIVSWLEHKSRLWTVHKNRFGHMYEAYILKGYSLSILWLFVCVMVHHFQTETSLNGCNNLQWGLYNFFSDCHIKSAHTLIIKNQDFIHSGFFFSVCVCVWLRVCDCVFDSVCVLKRSGFGGGNMKFFVVSR